MTHDTQAWHDMKRDTDVLLTHKKKQDFFLPVEANANNVYTNQLIFILTNPRVRNVYKYQLITQTK